MKTIPKILKSLLLSGLLIISYTGFTQQQPMYSQYMFNMLNVNPAYAGSRGTIGVTSLFRDQWTGMPGSPKTSVVSVDMPANEDRMGLGLQVYDDRIGVERSVGFNASYAYRIQLTEGGTLSLGLQAGMVNYRANFSEVSTFQSEDPAFYQNINGILPAAGAGIYYNSDNFYVGASVPALLKTKLSNTNKADVTAATGSDMHLYLTTGCVMDINEELVLKPSVMVKASSGAPVQYDINANLWVKNLISLGASYRSGDAVVGMIEWQINDNLRFGYAYDRTFSNLGMYNNGTHELMLRIEFGRSSERMSSARYF